MLSRTIPRRIKIELRLAKKSAGGSCRPDSDRSGSILNLALNARDAMPEGEGQLVIETKALENGKGPDRPPLGLESGSYVLMSVSDTGCGVSPYTREKIFDPFFTTKEPGKGIGLGLSTVFGIVSNHGGSIDCKTELGRGTSFDIYLPALSTALESEIVINPTNAGGCGLILLVDDDESVREVSRLCWICSGIVCSMPQMKRRNLFFIRRTAMK